MASPVISRSQKLHHKWTIDQFSNCNLKPTEFLESSIFFSEDIQLKSEWKLVLYPSGFTKGADTIGLFVIRSCNRLHKRETERQLHVNYTFAILNRQLNRINEKTFNNSFPLSSCKDVELGERDFLQINDVDQYLKDDTLTILCELTVFSLTTDDTEVGTSDLTPFSRKLTISDARFFSKSKFIENTDATFTWVLSDFKNLMEPIQSSTFTVQFNGNATEWGIEFIPMNDGSLNAECMIAVYLVMKRGFGYHMKIRHTLAIVLDMNFSDALVSKSGVNVFSEPYQCTRGYSDLISATTFREITDNLQCSVRIMYTLNLFDNIVNTPAERCLQLACAYSTLDEPVPLLETGELADIEFLIDGITIRAHKSILAAKSQVFLEQFLEKPSVAVFELNEMDYETMENVLRYIYTGSVENIERSAVKLLKAADKYKLRHLRALCEEVLITQINAGNVSALLDVAMAGNANHLKRYLAEFIMQTVRS